MLSVHVALAPGKGDRMRSMQSLQSTTCEKKKEKEKEKERKKRRKEE